MKRICFMICLAVFLLPSPRAGAQAYDQAATEEKVGRLVESFRRKTDATIVEAGRMVEESALFPPDSLGLGRLLQRDTVPAAASPEGLLEKYYELYGRLNAWAEKVVRRLGTAWRDTE